MPFDDNIMGVIARGLSKEWTSPALVEHFKVCANAFLSCIYNSLSIIIIIIIMIIIISNHAEKTSGA
jgi:hypothetical protein